jgi:hypothetical protein
VHLKRRVVFLDDLIEESALRGVGAHTDDPTPRSVPVPAASGNMIASLRGSVAAQVLGRNGNRGTHSRNVVRLVAMRGTKRLGSARDAKALSGTS